MSVEGGDPAVGRGSDKMGGKGGMTKTPGSLQDLSKSLYDKAKAEPTKRFWGLYVHVCKKETLQEAYRMAKKNNGAPGIDGVTFEAIEESGAESFLQQIRELMARRLLLRRLRLERTLACQDRLAFSLPSLVQSSAERYPGCESPSIESPNFATLPLPRGKRFGLARWVRNQRYRQRPASWQNVG